jgi:hypothetical protein
VGIRVYVLFNNYSMQHACIFCTSYITVFLSTRQQCELHVPHVLASLYFFIFFYDLINDDVSSSEHMPSNMKLIS